jgi:hypothetical protein
MDGLILKARIRLNNRYGPVGTTQFIRVDKNKNGITASVFPVTWNQLGDFSLLTPRKKMNVFDIDLESVKLDEPFYAVQWQCNLQIDQAGEYEFFTVSDDGSALFINNEKVVDNDGLHGLREESGKTNLEKGIYPFEVQYFQKGGGERLEILWKGPGISKQMISAKHFLKQ